LENTGAKGERVEPSAKLDALAHAVIGAALEVHRNLGPGFLESLYEEALCIELKLRGIPFVRQPGISVAYKGQKIGESKLDLLVGGMLVVELKAVDVLAPVHSAQVLSYLKATGHQLGLLINFNSMILARAIKRIILSQSPLGVLGVLAVKSGELMKTLLSITLLAVMLAATAQGDNTVYKPNWESIDKRPTPAWFDEAKFGVFIHWGVYSVPAWGPKGSYAEWYWHYMNDPKHPTSKYHPQTYGERFKYQDFAPMWKAELFNPDQWADIFARAGAKYIVLTSKHHEGFCLWPSADSWNWNSVDIGPHRDLCGDLSKAVKAKGIKMGFYYSLYEWYNPFYQTDLPRYVDQHMMPQMKDLVIRYNPSLVWTDGEWSHPSADWKSVEFLAWLFNESPVKDEVAVNDRWGKDTRSVHGGFYTTEYGQVHLGADLKLAERHKWEECRGIGASFGYNRNEDEEDYKSPTDLIHLLIETVAGGGNLLLDIGPTADGRIPVIMQQRLLEIGKWLSVNGEAIYGTRPWRTASEGDLVRYTCNGGAVYAICLKWPGKELILTAPKPSRSAVVNMLGFPGTLKWREKDGKLHIEVPPLSVDEVPCRHAYVFKLTGVE